MQIIEVQEIGGRVELVEINSTHVRVSSGKQRLLNLTVITSLTLPHPSTLSGIFNSYYETR